MRHNFEWFDLGWVVILRKRNVYVPWRRERRDRRRHLPYKRKEKRGGEVRRTFFVSMEVCEAW